MDQFTIERARRGDRDAQTALLRGLQDVWFRFCFSQLGNAEQARDATQETALRVLRRLPTFRGKSRIESWSIGIAINVIREQRRSAIRQQNLTGAAFRARSGATTVESRPDETFGNDEIQFLREVLGELPDRQRQALVLRYFEEMSVEETAAAMDCAAGTIKATVHQALRAIRRRIRQPGRSRT